MKLFHSQEASCKNKIGNTDKINEITIYIGGWVIIENYQHQSTATRHNDISKINDSTNHSTQSNWSRRHKHSLSVLKSHCILYSFLAFFFSENMVAKKQVQCWELLFDWYNRRDHFIMLVIVNICSFSWSRKTTGAPPCNI